MALSRKRRPVAVIDSETDPFAHGATIEPFLWVYYDHDGARVFWNDQESFVEFLLEQDAVVYAHNGSRFDFSFLYEYLEPGDRISFINGAPARIEFGRAELRDSIRILPLPLSALSKMRFDYAKMTRANREKHKAEIVEYCIDDCRQLYEAVLAFEEEFGRKLTVAGAAMSQFVKIHGEPIEDQGAGQYQLLKPFYFGGRCEVAPGKIGRFDYPLNVWDLNSAYPWACTFEHGCGPPMRRSMLPRRGPYFARIEAISDGCLPWRENPGDRIEYPRDSTKRIYHASHHEIEAGLETNTLHITRVLDVYTFQDRWTADRFVEIFYARKADAKKRMQTAETEAVRNRAKLDLTFAKLMLNGLYGKTGQDASRFRDHELIPLGQIERAYAKGHTLAGVLGDLAVIAKPPRHARWYDVAIAASVTAQVRARLWRAICASDDFHYCDTDSIMARDATLPVSAALGEWEHEGTFDRGAFAGRKLYTLRRADAKLGRCYACEHAPDHHTNGFGCARCDCRGFDDGWKTASKGTRLSPLDVYRVADGAPVTWEAEAPTFSFHRGRYYQVRTVTREGGALESETPE